MSETEYKPNWSVNLYEEQPDVGGNRHYDYISIEEHVAAEKTLEAKDKWSNLSSHEIIVLRHEAKKRGLIPDLIDHCDRLALIRCVFSWHDSSDRWREANDR